MVRQTGNTKVPAETRVTRTRGVKEAPAELFNPMVNIDDQLDAIEKDYTLSGSSLNVEEVRQTTGLLTLDLILSKGIVPGWYTFFGPEQSCKSTGASTMLGAALNSGIPILAYFDYEGSVSHDYLSNIMETQGIGMDLKHVFGLRDSTGGWAIKPRVRYYAEGVAEKFFDYLASLERKLPDKVKINDTWWLIYENTKVNQSLLKGHYDSKYLSKTGKLRVQALDGGLQAMILVDSYPAMLPERLDVDDPGAGMAAQARMFSEQLRRVKGKMKAKRIAVVGVNQLRKAPMVMYGCYHGSVKVTMADGTHHCIKDVVDKKMTGPVMAYNTSTKSFEPKPITNWFNNGPAKKWIKLVYKVGPVGSRASIVVTPEQLMWHNDFNSLVRASKFRVGDTLVSPLKYALSEHARQLYLGMMLGDGKFVAREGYVQLNYPHKEEQDWYMDWKKTILNFGGVTQDTVHALPPVYDEELYRLVVEGTKRQDKEKRISVEFVRSLDTIALAVWYMDTGSKGDNFVKMRPYSIKDVYMLCKEINAKYRAGCVVKTVTDDVGPCYGIKFDKKLMTIIAPYVHKRFREVVEKCVANNFGASVPPGSETAMPRYTHYFGEFQGWVGCGTVSGVRATIVKIEELGPNLSMEVLDSDGKPSTVMSSDRYEIEVKDLGMFVADGVVGKNSPEYEPGGEALKYLSDSRLRVFPRALSAVPGAKGKGMIEEEPSIMESGGTDSYRYIHIRAHKNKLGVPNLEGWLRLWITDGNGVARGFDTVWDTYYYLSQTGQISGQRKSLKLALVGRDNPVKSVGWMNFKVLVLGTRAQKIEVCKGLGIKPFDLRSFCKKQLHDHDGLDLYFAHLKTDQKAEAETEA